MGCTDTLLPQRGCQENGECAANESCLAGRCVSDPPADGGSGDGGGVDSGPQPDSGPGVDAGKADAGPVDAGNADGGVSLCTPDDFNNGGASLAWEPLTGTLADGRILRGHFCPNEDEYFAFSAVADPPPADVFQSIAAWPESADLDLVYIDPNGTVEPAAFTGHRFMEANTTEVTANGRQTLVLAAYTPDELPVAGMDFDLQIRSGVACSVEAACPGPNHCLMPIWTPIIGGREPDQTQRFIPGLCGPEYQSQCALPDADGHGGFTQSRDDATPIAEGSAITEGWSCQFDMDWFSHTLTETGHLTVEFQNRTAQAGSYLVAVFDAEGNMLRGMGYDRLLADDPQNLQVPYLAAGDQVFIRIFQLHSDDVAEYQLAVAHAAANCTTNADCTGNPYSSDFGRTECDVGACVCPVTGCVAP